MKDDEIQWLYFNRLNSEVNDILHPLKFLSSCRSCVLCGVVDARTI